MLSAMRIPAKLQRIAAVTCIALLAWHLTVAQHAKSKVNCTGLHAGITAQLTQGYSEPSVMVAFLLLNDSDTAQSTAPESWKIVIDGQELSDSDWLFETVLGQLGGMERLQQRQPSISAWRYQSPSTFLKIGSTELAGRLEIFKVQQ